MTVTRFDGFGTGDNFLLFDRFLCALETYGTEFEEFEQDDGLIVHRFKLPLKHGTEVYDVFVNRDLSGTVNHIDAHFVDRVDI